MSTTVCFVLQRNLFQPLKAQPANRHAGGRRSASTQPAVIDPLTCANNDSAVVSTLPLPLRCTRDGEDGACDQLGIVNRRSVPEAGQDGECRAG